MLKLIYASGLGPILMSISMFRCFAIIIFLNACSRRRHACDMPDSFNCRPFKCVSTTNRKCHKLFALFLVNIWIVQLQLQFCSLSSSSALSLLYTMSPLDVLVLTTALSSLPSSSAPLYYFPLDLPYSLSCPYQWPSTPLLKSSPVSTCSSSSSLSPFSLSSSPISFPSSTPLSSYSWVLS